MTTVLTIFFVLLSVLAAFLLYAPKLRLSSEEFRPAADWREKDKAERREQLSEDLELDFQTGKLSQVEYERMHKKMN